MKNLISFFNLGNQMQWYVDDEWYAWNIIFEILGCYTSPPPSAARKGGAPPPGEPTLDGAVLRHPVGNPKRKVWEAQQQVSLSCETKVYRTSKRKPNFRRRCLLALWHFGQWRQKDTIDVKLFTSSNMEPAHNITKNFVPNLRWGCQSHRFAVNKGLSVSSGKRVIVCKNVNRASNSKQ
jgi:hypothetical protein